MKLFAVGNYDEYDVYALVMAETEEEAINKVRNLKVGDVVNAGNYKIDKYELSHREYDILTTDRVTEIPSGIFITENT